MRTKFNFNHLECFYSLAKTLSFSKTSIELGIAQPAVSKQISTLENELKIQLFLRTKKTVILSPQGKHFFDETMPLYKELINKATNLTTPQKELSGIITFGCLQEVGEHFFIHALSAFKRLHPKVQFTVKFLKAFEIIDEVKRGTIEIGIVPNKIEQENINTYPIFEEKIILVTNFEHSKKNISKAIELPFVLFREQDPLLEFYLKKVYPKKKFSKIKPEFIVNSHKAMISVLKQHNLYGVLPMLSVEKELRDKSLIDIGPAQLKSMLYLIHLNNSYMDQKLIAFTKFLRKYKFDQED